MEGTSRNCPSSVVAFISTQTCASARTICVSRSLHTRSMSVFLPSCGCVIACLVKETRALGAESFAKKTPDDAVRIINLPTNLETDTTHRYGENAFKLHGLPVPRPWMVRLVRDP